MLSIANLNLSIAGTRILSDISLSVARGEMVGLIGPNGSGKTSLFNCISGFVEPQHGQIFFLGSNITEWPAARRASSGIGRVFQNFGIFREMTLIENLLTALESRDRKLASLWPWSMTTRNHRAEAMDLLSEINLSDRYSQKAANLSGGQMRLLEITRAMAFGAELFLLDEPTAGVSPKMKDDVARAIVKLKELHKTVMVIEHDMNFIHKFCVRLVVLDIGQIILDGPPDKVRADPRLQEIYFGN